MPGGGRSYVRKFLVIKDGTRCMTEVLKGEWLSFDPWLRFPGNAEWLYCKVRVCGVSSVIQDLDQSSQYMDCPETGLIRDTLVLMRPSVDFLGGHMGRL